MEKKVLYLCDGLVESCTKTGCYKIGFECRHTSDEAHALNPPENRRFIDSDPDFLWEIEANEGGNALDG